MSTQRPPSTAPLRLGLMGHPVHHSRSPGLHQAAMTATGLSGTYELLDVEPEGLARVVQELRVGRWTGLNVTVPHKERVAVLCDRLGESARELGVVNTLVRGADGAVEGHNTDLDGLMDALQGWQPEEPWRGRTACVLGSGGAARAAVAAVTRLGAVSVRLWNRTPARAQALVRQPGLNATVVSSLAEALDGATLILQATSVGMGLRAREAEWLQHRDAAVSVLARVPDEALLMDLVYGTDETPWVAAARQRGIEAVDGLGMLVCQGARAFTLWTGRAVPLEVMKGGLAVSGGALKGVEQG